MSRKIYKHFKHGDLYEYLREAIHSETGEILVIYRSLETSEVFARPKVMFFEEVNGVQRFKRVGEWNE